MKTLVLFSTLTALAVAIPNLSGKQLEESSLLQDKKTLKRNTEFFDSELKTPIMGLDSELNENQERTFLKKKLLHKKLKKFRNTEEEAKSESQEKNMTKFEGTQCNEHKSQEWTLSDLDQAVKVVTEAIERLEGDINKQEEEKKMSESKTRKSRNAENVSEGEMAEAVKKAKDALEHVRGALFNLRELHFPIECLNRTELQHTPALAHEQLNEFERLAQWKEAMENIHRNVEIARNLEDNFKSESDENKPDSSSLESEKIEQQITNNKESHLKGDEKNKTSPLHKENKSLEKMGHNTKSDSDSDIAEDKQEDQMKKVESDSHVAASNQMAHVLKPETKAESGNKQQSTEAKPENNQLTESQMNSKSQQMGQFRFSQQESMRSNEKLHESHAHAEHDQNLISFMKASDEHNQRFHSTKQNNHHESPMGSHGMMPQGRSAEIANVMWDNMSDMRSAPIHNRWQELHRSRGSYGPSLNYGTMQPSSGSASSGSATTSGGNGSGSGAVGVFPNAKIRDCGIPLLLSCNPSVVQGTLSKTSSYSAPAYRAGSEHFNFNNKRDTKKVNRFQEGSH